MTHQGLCDGKRCGDFCALDDISGRCDANGTCTAAPGDLDCGKLPLCLYTSSPSP